MSKEISPYTIRRTGQPEDAEFRVPFEDSEGTLQEDLHQYWRTIRKRLGLVVSAGAKIPHVKRPDSPVAPE